MKIPSVQILRQTLLGCVASMPFVSLFWQAELGFIKMNWILYPILIFGFAMFIIARRAISFPFLAFLILSVFYLLLFVIRRGDVEAFFRLFIAVLPFLFLSFFDDIDLKTIKLFFIFYVLFFLPSLYMAHLQYEGKLPYNEFDYVDGVMVGRMSGGYSKPTNFVAFLTPIYIFCLYVIIVRKQRFFGGVLLGIILVLVYLVGHRTSLAAFVVIASGMFFKRGVFIFIYNYYKYFLNFFVGIGAFLFFYLLYLKEGLVDAIRGRVPMWQAHAQEFFQSGVFSILFGKQKVLLPEYYNGNPLVVRFDEVHNNAFRTILLFGVVGYFAYCVFMRWVVLSSYHAQPDRNKRFVIFSCFVYFIFYTVTNEPFYYGSVVWPILMWVFLLRNQPDETR